MPTPIAIVRSLRFLEGWLSPAQSIASKRPNNSQSVHGEAKFTEDCGYYTPFQTIDAKNTTLMHKGPEKGESAKQECECNEIDVARHSVKSKRAEKQKGGAAKKMD